MFTNYNPELTGSILCMFIPRIIKLNLYYCNFIKIYTESNMNIEYLYIHIIDQMLYIRKNKYYGRSCPHLNVKLFTSKILYYKQFMLLIVVYNYIYIYIYIIDVIGSETTRSVKYVRR